MPSPMLSPHGSGMTPEQGDTADNEKQPADREQLRLNLAQLKIGDECLRRKRLLGGVGSFDYETYSLPVSRVPIHATPPAIYS